MRVARFGTKKGDEQGGLQAVNISQGKGRYAPQPTDGQIGTMLRFDVAQGLVVSGGLVQSSRRLLARDFEFNCVIWKAFGNLTFVTALSVSGRHLTRTPDHRAVSDFRPDTGFSRCTLTSPPQNTRDQVQAFFLRIVSLYLVHSLVIGKYK